MRLTRIAVTDFQAVTHVDIEIDRPVLFIAGPNEQGKSSIADAVRLALDGDMGRIDHKKDAGQLVRTGAQKGAKIAVEGDGFSAAVSLPSNVAKRSGIPGSDALLTSLLPSRFADMKPDARRAFLFPILGIESDPEAIAKRIVARGANAEKLEKLVPVIGRAPWEDIATEAKAYATRAKGAWEQITNEKWGATKAEQWVPTAPSAPTEGTPASVQKSIDDIDARISELNQAIGAQNAALSLVKGRTDRMAQLARDADLLDRRVAAHGHAKAELDDLAPKIEAMRNLAAGHRVGKECQCPDCGAALLYLGDGGLQRWPDAVDADALADARAKLPNAEKAFAVLAKAVANAERDVKTSLDAKAERERLLAEPVPEADEAVIVKLRSEIDSLRDQRRTHETTLNKMKAHETAVAGAETARDNAAAKHRDVVEWLEIADLVGPAGVPGELLTEGLSKINGKLSELAMLAGWDAPVIRDDMAITVGQHGYRLGSVSARYRADVLLAIAIAILSGLRFVMFDGAEVLVGPQRGRLLNLARALAGSVLDTVIVIATLKERPRLPAEFRAVWIEGGQVASEEDAREAA